MALLCHFALLTLTAATPVSSAGAFAAGSIAPPAVFRVDSSTGTWRDSTNRTRIWHGMNLVEKSEPFYPALLVQPHVTNTIASFKQIGTTAVRLGVMMGGLFPDATMKPNTTYMAIIKGIVAELDLAGIGTIIDLHQDVLSPAVCGEGVPRWAVNASQLGSMRFPEPLSFTNTSVPDPASGGWTPAPDCSPVGPLKFIGWSEWYMTDACGKAFADIYREGNLLHDLFEEYWRYVPSQLASVTGVIAYELMNEPWVGDWLSHPSLLLEGGKAETEAVGLYMQRMHKLVRESDPSTPVLFAPAEINNRLMRRVGFEKGFLPGEPMAFHTYCVVGTDSAGPTGWFDKALCHVNDGLQVGHREADLRRLGTAGFVTEFGGVSDSDTGRAEVRYVASKLDAMSPPSSWCYWAFWSDPPSTQFLKEIARSYPTATAGTLQTLTFNPDDGKLEFTFMPTPSSETATDAAFAVAATTEIFLAQMHYPNGFILSCSTPCDYTRTSSGASVKLVQSPSVPEQPVTVTVSRRVPLPFDVKYV